MKMIFAADEVVKVKNQFCGTWDVKKQDIADFLSSNLVGYSQNIILERTIILSNLINVISIEIDDDIIILQPIGIKMRASNETIYFLKRRNKLLNQN